MSEADLETHGVVRQDNGYDMSVWDEVVSDPRFYDQLKERELSNAFDSQFVQVGRFGAPKPRFRHFESNVVAA